MALMGGRCKIRTRRSLRTNRFQNGTLTIRISSLKESALMKVGSLELLAESTGFEPVVVAYSDLANQPVKPLQQLSLWLTLIDSNYLHQLIRLVFCH